MLELILRFLLVGAVAFGGGQAALPLVERLAVVDTGWLTPQQFGVGVALAYATPGPVLILAAYVGQRVAGLTGALAATVAVFTVPVFLSIAAAHTVARLTQSQRFRAFGRFAGAAAIGLLGVTLFSLARPVAAAGAALFVPVLGVFFAERRGLPPTVLLASCALLGALRASL